MKTIIVILTFLMVVLNVEVSLGSPLNCENVDSLNEGKRKVVARFVCDLSKEATRLVADPHIEEEEKKGKLRDLFYRGFNPKRTLEIAGIRCIKNLSEEQKVGLMSSIERIVTVDLKEAAKKDYSNEDIILGRLNIIKSSFELLGLIQKPNGGEIRVAWYVECLGDECKIVDVSIEGFRLALRIKDEAETKYCINR